MVALPEPCVGTYAEPPCPLTPELRSDIAFRRAQGHPWLALGVSLHYDCDALRRATENDPDFAAAQEKAWAEATWEGEAEAMARLRGFVKGSDDTQAMHASEVLVRYARERRRDDTRLAVEKLRTETQRARIEARAEDAPLPSPVPYRPRTDEEWAAEREQHALENVKKQDAEVYVWGGKHSIGMSVPPDESDTRVRVVTDWSCGCGQRHAEVLWVIPLSARSRVSGVDNFFPEDNPDVPAYRPSIA